MPIQQMFLGSGGVASDSYWLFRGDYTGGSGLQPTNKEAGMGTMELDADGSVYLAIGAESLYPNFFKLSNKGDVQWRRSLQLSGYYSPATGIELNGDYMYAVTWKSWDSMQVSKISKSDGSINSFYKIATGSSEYVGYDKDNGCAAMCSGANSDDLVCAATTSYSRYGYVVYNIDTSGNYNSQVVRSPSPLSTRNGFSSNSLKKLADGNIWLGFTATFSGSGYYYNSCGLVNLGSSGTGGGSGSQLYSPSQSNANRYAGGGMAYRNLSGTVNIFQGGGTRNWNGHTNAWRRVPTVIKHSSGGWAQNVYQVHCHRSDGDGQNGLFNDVAVDEDGNIYAVGRNSFSSIGGECGYLAKFNSSMQLQFWRVLRWDGVSGGSELYRIEITPNGSMLIAGKVGKEAFCCQLPPDGSLTGTHGSFIYEDYSSDRTVSVNPSGSPSYTNAGISSQSTYGAVGTSVSSFTPSNQNLYYSTTKTIPS